MLSTSHGAVLVLLRCPILSLCLARWSSPRTHTCVPALMRTQVATRATPRWGSAGL